MITDKALFDFGAPNGEMRLISLHAGVALEAVRAEMSWQPVLAEQIQATPPPSEDELQRIRVELDPEGMYRK